MGGRRSGFRGYVPEPRQCLPITGAFGEDLRSGANQVTSAQSHDDLTDHGVVSGNPRPFFRSGATLAEAADEDDGPQSSAQQHDAGGLGDGRRRDCCLRVTPSGRAVREDREAATRVHIDINGFSCHRAQTQPILTRIF